LEHSEKIKYDLGIENHNGLFLNEFESSFKKVTSTLAAWQRGLNGLDRWVYGLPRRHVPDSI